MIREWRHEPFLDFGFEAAVHTGNVIFQPGMFWIAFVSQDPVHDTPLTTSDGSGTTTPYHSSLPCASRKKTLTEYAPQFRVVVDMPWV
jgi:hypothetical protein